MMDDGWWVVGDGWWVVGGGYNDGDERDMK